jgi:hypothetical protein
MILSAIRYSLKQFIIAFGIFAALCLFFVVFLQNASPKERGVDVVVSSFDRPLQLYAYLESQEHYLTGVNQTHIIYRASEARFEKAYRQVQKRFPEAHFHKQSTHPKSDFKPLVWASIYSSKSASPYVMFAVDDIIFTDYVDLKVCTKAIEDYKAWGFFLRLGKNITYCYMKNKPSLPPVGKDLGDMFTWKFGDGKGDWRYPNNTDNTIYRKKDIQAFLKNEKYTNPNTLEVHWQKWRNMKKMGLCFQTSKNINIPCNCVQQSYKENRHNQTYTTDELLAKFQQGLKIDILKFYQVNNNSPHVDYVPTFTPR